MKAIREIGQQLGGIFNIPVILLPLLLFAAGCATGVTQGTPAPAGPSASQLTVFRPGSFVGSMETPMVKINGADTCRIANASAFTRTISPGNLSITSSEFGVIGTSSLSFTAAAGQTYYVKYSPDQGEAWAGAFGGYLGEAIQQATTQHPGPFDIELTSEVAMGTLKPGVCNH